MSDAAEKSAAEQKRRQGRSPSYPSISLSKALSKAQALYDAEGKYPAPMPSAFAAWGYGAKSSGGREIRAALKYFGLITIEGDGETGKVKLSEDALRVIIDKREDQTEKNAILRRLAVAPAIHKTLFESYPDGIKSDASVEHFLVFEQGYNESAAADVVKVFKETAEFTELYKPANNVVKEDPKPDRTPAKVSVGDLVEVAVGGVIALPAPARVRAIQTKDGTDWVFVDGSEAAVPMEQVQAVSKAGEQAHKPGVEPPRLPLEPQDDPEWREERLLDEEGDEIFIKYKGAPSQQRYEFIRDYLDFKLKRMKPTGDK